MKILFVGEVRSELAKKRGVYWEDRARHGRQARLPDRFSEYRVVLNAEPTGEFRDPFADDPEGQRDALPGGLLRGGHGVARTRIPCHR